MVINNNMIKNYTEGISSSEKVTNRRKEDKSSKKFNKSEKEIEAILNEYIAPAVESDGGSITLNYYRKNIVCVDLKGACSGCPSSTSTLKGGIESLLKQKVSPDIKVIANEK